MAEAFGIVAGAVSIAAVFTTCIDCFDYVQAGRHFKRDFQTERLKLDCVRYRLTSWGHVVDIYACPQADDTATTGEKFELAKQVFLHILDLFEKTKKISERYRPETVKESTSISSDEHHKKANTSLGWKFRQLALTRRRGTGLLGKAEWAIHHHAELANLVEGITRLVDELERMFNDYENRMRLVQDDVAELEGDEGLEALAYAAHDTDPVLQNAVDNSMKSGHRYSKMQSTSGARMLNGDSFANSWVHPFPERYNSYSNIRAEGSSKVLNGNKYGGKDFFED